MKSLLKPLSRAHGALVVPVLPLVLAAVSNAAVAGRAAAQEEETMK